MSEENVITKKRDRSPSFPYVGLNQAIDYVEKLFKLANRHEVRLADAAVAWDMKPKSSSTLRVAAALNAFGLTDESGSGGDRRVRISDDARRILEDTRQGVRDQLVRAAALKPAMINHYFEKWGHDRPEDRFALSDLKFESNFTDEGAQKFLRVFDETIKASGLDRTGAASAPEPTRNMATEARAEDTRPSGMSSEREVSLDAPFSSIDTMPGERELLAGILSKQATFRLLVSGPIGPREIDKLIAKLQIDKDILASES